jgi:hypothetical protein
MKKRISRDLYPIRVILISCSSTHQSYTHAHKLHLANYYHSFRDLYPIRRISIRECSSEVISDSSLYGYAHISLSMWVDSDVSWSIAEVLFWMSSRRAALQLSGRAEHVGARFQKFIFWMRVLELCMPFMRPSQSSSLCLSFLLFCSIFSSFSFNR